MVVEQEAGVSNPSEVGQEVWSGSMCKCVPATITQAERVFSWMGWMLNKRRLNMSDESVIMQLFLKDNMEI